MKSREKVLIIEDVMDASSKDNLGDLKVLKDEIIENVAEKTLIGSAYLLEHTNEEVHKLRKDVTSPKGTTEAGLKVLMENNNFFNIVDRAINEAQKRGKDLGKI